MSSEQTQPAETTAVAVIEQNGAFLIPSNKTNEVLIIEGQEKLIISRADLEAVLFEIETLKQDADLMEWGIMQICSLLGMTTPDGKSIRPEILNEEESAMSGLLKSGAELFALFSKAQMPAVLGGASATKKLNEKLSFVEKMVPLMKKRSKK